METVIWFPGSRMQRGLRTRRRQPRSAAGVGAPATHRGGAGAEGTQELGRRCLQGLLAGWLAGWKAADGSKRGVRGPQVRWGLLRQPRWGPGPKGEERQKAYSTRYSQAVSHPTTNQAQPCLASEIRRSGVFRS